MYKNAPQPGGGTPGNPFSGGSNPNSGAPGSDKKDGKDNKDGVVDAEFESQ